MISPSCIELMKKRIVWLHQRINQIYKKISVGNGTSVTGHAKWGATMGEIFILEKNVWNKSCFFLWDLQNELSYVTIGLQIKKFLFFGLSQFSRLFLHKRENTKGGTPGGEK